MKTLLLLTTAALAMQVAFAQPETKPKWESSKAVMTLVSLVRSPNVRFGKGVISQRAPEPSDQPFEYGATVTVSADFGIGMAYRMKDKTLVRLLEEAGKKVGLEIWWDSPEFPGVPNVLTVRSDGSYGYCRIDGKVRHPLEVTDPDSGLSKEEISAAFEKMSIVLEGHLTPR